MKLNSTWRRVYEMCPDFRPPTRLNSMIRIVLNCSFLILFLTVGASSALSSQQAGFSLSGLVLDMNGAAVVNAMVRIKSTSSSFERTVRTNSEGLYRFGGLASGSFTLTAKASGFHPGIAAITIINQSLIANIGLGTATLSEEVTVTAQRGQTEALLLVPEGVSIVNPREVRERRAITFPQLLQGATGVAVQQTSTSQGSPFVRGLTGKQVVTLIDGLRYNNSTFRPGPNQFTALIEPANVERVEVVRGPNAAQYGSDSFGGTINVLTSQPAPFAEIGSWQGGLDFFFGSADLSAGGSGTFSAATKRTSFIAGGAARGTQDLRPGSGRDSRAAVTRFLGLDSRVLGARLQDTKFQQYAGFGKFIWTPTLSSRVTLSYQHGEQRNGRRYDEMNGGNGNLLSSFDPQVLNFFYARYEQSKIAGLDSLTAIFSINSQRDDRRSQGGLGDARRSITDETNRTDAFGYVGQAAKRIGDKQSLVFGAEVYDEYITSLRTETDPVTNVTTSVRPRYPNGTRYTSFGAFVQNSVQLIERLRVAGGLRYSLFNYRQFASRNPFTTNGRLAVPDARVQLDDVTFNLGAVVKATEWLALSGIINRGFRAPNVSDFGAIGLTSSGFEVTPQEAGATGTQIEPLTPETLYNYEGGVKIHSQRFEASTKIFISKINGLIERRSLLLPLGAAVGQTIGGQVIIRQGSAGEVFTGLTAGPVQVRQNTGPVLLRGFEAAFRAHLKRTWLLTANTAYVRNNIKGTDQPARFQGFAPPWISYVAARWEPLGSSHWIELYSTLAYKQGRFSPEDVGEQRLGAARSRNDIATFFRNGAVARNLVRDSSASGQLRLLQTGETLAQLQDRLLPVGATVNGVTIADNTTSVPLYTSTAGFATLNARLGHRLRERHTIIFSIENIFDKNYRINGSGIDSAGINLALRYSLRF